MLLLVYVLLFIGCRIYTIQDLEPEEYPEASVLSSLALPEKIQHDAQGIVGGHIGT